MLRRARALSRIWLTQLPTTVVLPARRARDWPPCPPCRALTDELRGRRAGAQRAGNHSARRTRLFSPIHKKSQTSRARWCARSTCCDNPGRRGQEGRDVLREQHRPGTVDGRARGTGRGALQATGWPTLPSRCPLPYVGPAGTRRSRWQRCWTCRYNIVSAGSDIGWTVARPEP